jgi:hypothetical protein
MAIKFLQNIDLGQNQILNAKIHVGTSEPANSGKGSIWLDSNTGQNVLKFHNGSSYVSVLDDTNTALTTFTLTADSGTNQTVSNAETLDIAGGTSITTTVGNTNTVTIDVTDNTIGAAELNVSGNGGATQFLRSDGDGSFSWAVPTDTNTNTQLSTEQVQDIVGAMFTGNTETRIAATYEDGDGTIDLVVTDMTANDNTVTSIRRDNTGTYRTGNVNLVGGTNVTISETSAGVFSFASTDTNTNTQNTFTSSFVDSQNDVLLRLTKAGAASGTQDIKFVAGTNITLTPDDSSNMTITATDTNTQLSTSQVRSKISGSGVISYNSSTGVITSSATATNAANVRAALNSAMASNTLTIGDGSTTTTIPGNLTVTGTTTTNNVEVVSTSNGVVFEGSAADANEGTLLAGTLSADRTYTLPNKTGTVAMTSDITGVNSGENTGDQAVWKSIVSDSGTAVANSLTDTLTIAGGSNVSTAVSGDTLTITATDTNTQLSTEQVQDIVGAMFSSNTETRISATYEDGDGTIDLVVDDMTANTNTQNAYSTSVVSSSGIKLRLSGSGEDGNTTDDVTFAGSGATSVARTDASTITISSTDTNTVTTAGSGITLAGTAVSVTQFTGALAAATSNVSKSSNTYTITHGLGNARVNVIITTVDSPFEQVFPEIQYANAAGNGTVKVIFGQSVNDAHYNFTITK